MKWLREVRVRLELRLTIWLTVLLAASAALTLFGMARFESQRLDRQAREAALVLAQATENSLEVSMRNNALGDIRRTVHNVEQGELIDSVTVYRRNGTAWVSSSASRDLELARRDALLRSMNEDEPATSQTGSAMSVFVPVHMKAECVGCHAGEGDVLGAVEVRMDQGPFQEQVAQSARASLYLAAIPLVFGVALSIWAVRRRLLRPLAQVGSAASRLGQGDLSVRLPEFEGWELAEVSTTFNDMAGRLETQAADLRASVEQLRSDLEGMEEIQAMLASGAGLGDVLARAAGNLGWALEAVGVGIWRAGDEAPTAAWGQELPSSESVRLAEADGVLTPEGVLEEVPLDDVIAWIAAPVRRDERTLGVVGVRWDPPRSLDPTRRDLLLSLLGLVGIAIQNADLLESLRKKEASLQAVLRKTITVQEEERRRISRELHDETSQVLSALMMNIDVLESQYSAERSAPEWSQTRVEAVKALAEEAARNLDKMMLDLRPALLDELGLIPALRWYVAQVSDLWGLSVEFEGERVGRLPDHIEVAAFRIVQEAISNVVRHAHASGTKVRVGIAGQMLRLEVSDDGVGFDVAEATARARAGEAVGLLGMRERAELVGGVLRIESMPGAGTKIGASIPLPEGGAEGPEGAE